MLFIRKIPQVETPAAEPVITTQFLKDHTKIEYDAEDTLVAHYIATATDYLQRYTRRQFVEATLAEYADDFAYNFPMVLEMAPIKSVSKVEYIAEGATIYSTLDKTVYDADRIVEPAYLKLAEDGTWPDLAKVPNAVKVTYVAGYGTAAEVPDTIKHAVALQAASHFFEREDARRERYMRTSMKIIQPFVRYYY